MKIRLTNEFKYLCERIILLNWTEEQWAENSGEDFLHSDKFEGSFDPDSKTFRFIHITSDFEEFEFQLKLSIDRSRQKFN